jgi:AraC-like DNA-binding protein
MPTIIRHALFRKLSSLHEWQRLREDFEIVTGLELQLADNVGRLVADDPPSRTLRGTRKPSANHGATRQKFRQELLQRAVKGPAFSLGEGGWIEAAVPVGLSGISVGFFVFSGKRSARTSGGSITEDLAQACLRWLVMAADRIAAKLTSHVAQAPKVMPRPVVKACAIIRAKSLQGEIHLPEMARACSISQGHLSRLFHHSTGMTFREYIARFRLEHAKELLARSGKSVTACAFASGFQSISQFHRVFRQVYGMSPRQWLAQAERNTPELSHGFLNK